MVVSAYRQRGKLQNGAGEYRGSQGRSSSEPGGPPARMSAPSSSYRFESSTTQSKERNLTVSSIPKTQVKKEKPRCVEHRGFSCLSARSGYELGSFRRTMPAKPRSPEPSNASDPGSGTVVVWPAWVMGVSYMVTRGRP